VTDEPALPAAEQYVEDVLNGTITAGRLVRLACARHRKDLETGHERGLIFDEEAGARAIEFFGFLHHSKGEWAGEVFELAGWQAFIVWSLFGWKIKASGLRRFRNAYDEIARKNGKSTLAAGIGLLLFIADGEPGAEVYTAATKRDQAKITHGEAERMVKASPGLRKIIRIVRDNMHVPDTASKFEPLGADADTMDGLNIHGAVVDELHAHKTRAVLDVIETATGARRQPLIFKITTAGYDRTSVCWDDHIYAIQILEGTIEDDAFFAFIASIDEDDDWRDPAVWPKANPNLGISAKLDDLQVKCTKAREMATAQNAFRRLHLNEWTEQSVRWLDIEKWDKCPKVMDPEQLAGRTCYGGLDLSTKIDLTARALVFPPEPDDETKTYQALLQFFLPEDNMKERVERDRVPYDVWARAGLITLTPGNVIDYAFIRETVQQDAKRYNLIEMGYDPWNATQLAVQLVEDGIEMVEVRQGPKSMAEPTKELEALVKSRRLNSGGNPVLRWNAANVTVRTDPNDNYMPDKAKSYERIDGIVALLMGLGRAIVSANSQSVYTSRGLTILG
jgi:phage terminase large subunit-like protein